jgi:hypothetical protein
MIPANAGAEAEVPPVAMKYVFVSVVWQEVEPGEIRATAQIK